MTISHLKQPWFVSIGSLTTWGGTASWENMTAPEYFLPQRQTTLHENAEATMAVTAWNKEGLR